MQHQNIPKPKTVNTDININSSINRNAPKNKNFESLSVTSSNESSLFNHNFCTVPVGSSRRSINRLVATMRRLIRAVGIRVIRQRNQGTVQIILLIHSIS